MSLARFKSVETGGNQMKAKVKCSQCVHASFSVFGRCKCHAQLINEEMGYVEIENPEEIRECDLFVAD